jgi:hypothetical protein
MSDIPPGAAGTQAVPPPQTAHAPFPGVRLLYAFCFSVVAWFVFWLTLLLALVQFIMIAINGRVNEELRHFCANLVQYLVELLAYITFMRDEQPFPIGPFPNHRPA